MNAPKNLTARKMRPEKGGVAPLPWEQGLYSHWLRIYDAHFNEVCRVTISRRGSADAQANIDAILGAINARKRK